MARTKQTAKKAGPSQEDDAPPQQQQQQLQPQQQQQLNAASLDLPPISNATNVAPSYAPKSKSKGKSSVPQPPPPPPLTEAPQKNILPQSLSNVNIPPPPQPKLKKAKKASPAKDQLPSIQKKSKTKASYSDLLEEVQPTEEELAELNQGFDDYLQTEAPAKVKVQKRVLQTKKQVKSFTVPARMEEEEQYFSDDNDDDNDDYDDDEFVNNNLDAEERPRVPFTDFELQKTKNSLKSQVVKKAHVVLNREKLFDRFNITSHFPLEKIPDSLSVRSGILTMIDLTGVDQLTDMFFRVVLDRIPHGSFKSVHDIYLTGCHHLTDWGIKWMAEMFKGLVEVKLSGCRKLTEGALVYLLEGCKDFQRIEAMCTDVGIVPVPRDSGPMGFVVRGCPIVTPGPSLSADSSIMAVNQYFTELNKQPNTSVYKAVVVRSKNVHIGLLDWLQKKKTPANQVAAYASMQVPGDLTYNMYECTEDLLDLFLSDRIMVLLPVDADLELKKNQDDLRKVVMHVMTKVPDAVFLLVCISKSGSPKTKSIDLYYSMSDMLNSETERLIFNETGSFGQYPGDLDFQDQMNISRLYIMKEAINFFHKGTRYVDVTLDKTEDIELVLKAMYDYKSTTDLRYPEYTHFGPEVQEVMNKVKPAKEFQRAEYVTRQMTAGKKLGERMSPYRKTLHYMNLLGSVVYPVGLHGEYVITDPAWFCDILNTMMAPVSTTAKDDVLFLHKETPVLKIKALEQILKQANAERQLPLVLDFISDVGLGHIVSTADQTDGSIVLFHHMSDDLPVPEDHFLPEPNSCYSIKTSYRMVHSISDSIITAVLHHILATKWPVMSLVTCRNRVLLTDISGVVMEIKSKDDGRNKETTTITIDVDLPSPGNIKGVTGILCALLEKGETVVEHCLAVRSIAYQKFNGPKRTLPGKDMQFNKAMVPYSGVRTGHKMKGCEGEDRCLVCGLAADMIRPLWHMKQTLCPKMSPEEGISLVSGVQVKGNWITVMPNTQPFNVKKSMNPTNFSSFEVCLLLGRGICVGIIRNNKTVLINMETGTITKDNQDLFTAPKDLQHIQILMTSDQKGQWKLHFVSVGETLYSVDVDSYDYRPYFKPVKQTTFLLDCRLQESNLSGEPVTWEEGMKLEALDRKNPHLTCVATVDSIKPDGRLLIHFDGWTSTFDYLADPTSPDLHPVGFMNKTSSERLQAPRGYGGTFSWDKYIIQTKATPAPHFLFTQEQTKGCPPYEFSTEAKALIKSKGNILHCGLETAQYTSEAIYQELLRELDIPAIPDLPPCMVSQAPERGIEAWIPGMRLEAWDKKTPSLVCVATVETIYEDGQILIHFDGWSKTYDYVTTIDDPAIHPLGFMLHNAHNHPELNQRLQQPNGYNKQFSWDTYLPEMEALPVPHYLFTEEQKENTPPYEFEPDTNSYLLSKGFPLQAHKGLGKIKKKKMPSLTGSGDAFLPSTTPGVLLPDPLTKQLLLYPTTSSLQTDSKAMHFLCQYSKDGVHFLDAPGYSLPPDEQVLVEKPSLKKFIAHSTMKLSQQRSLLPANTSKLLPGKDEKDLSSAVVQKGIQKLLHLYNVMAYHNIGKSILTSEFTPEEEAKQVLENLYRNLCKENVKITKATPDDRGHNLSICEGHRQCHSEEAHLSEFPLDQFKVIPNMITELNFSHNNIQALPDALFTSLPYLETINFSNNSLKSLPLGIGSCSDIAVINIKHNYLEQLPADFADCSASLLSLNISNNPLLNIPLSVFQCTNLVILFAANIRLHEMNKSIENLSQLEVLDLSGHMMKSLPEELRKLKNLQELHLSGMKWIEGLESSRALLGKEGLKQHLNKHPESAQLKDQEITELFESCSQNGQGTLDSRGIQKLNAILFNKYPRFQATEGNNSGCPPQIFSLTKLHTLDLSYQGLAKIPEQVGELKELMKLDLSHNPQLESVAGDLGLLPLASLSLRGCPSLKTPPKEIVHRGFHAIYGYLKRLTMGSVAVKRTKLMLVGLGGAGKTSLVTALTDGHMRYSRGQEEEVITDGISITNWGVALDDQDETLTFSVWDFAGQTVYYNTHQFFLSNRAVYLLLWNIRLGHEHAGLDFWLSSISCHAPKAPIIVVGSHADQVEKYWLPAEEMKKRYPQIIGFHAISSYYGTGIPELSQELIDVALKQEYMGEQIPQVYLNFEQKIIKERSKRPLIPITEVEQLAVECGIFDKSELRPAMMFLHDLGSLQYFQNQFLRSQVVIDPQWIVDVMACVVSVHDTPIKDGRLAHSDISRVWSKYDKSLHNWLLRLTEEFDLTFPLPEEKANIVPCLLPETEPEYTWPDVSGQPEIKETKTMYKFDYLPAGLFNRAQVRLYQFSDNSVMWKKGSLLKKNGHTALMLQLRESQVAVKVQGMRPENIVFMVHEVFEALIAESFHGVTYDFFIPCVDCLKGASMEPCMFPVSKVQRATELKVPFLQCDKYFHTLPLTELHAQMPPNSGDDFDVHLERSIRDLRDIQIDLTTDIFMLYSTENIPEMNEESLVHPHDIKEDLQSRGFKVWYPQDPRTIDIQSVALTIKAAQVVLVCISTEFVNDSHLCNILHYARQNLQKKIILVVLGKNMDWQKTSIGMLFASEVFVNMTQKSRYQHKIKELVDALTNRVDHPKKTVKYPKCFISYCWSNSAEAVKKGSRSVPGALGWGDPREIKIYLQENGINSWMDIERVGQGGLFEDIAEGLRHAKVFIACVSDEYAASKNCQLEFRFASISLKIPMIIVPVGTGYKWEKTEIGMLALGSPKISFQFESTNARERLLEAVRECIPEEDETEDEKNNSTENGKETAFQELLELIQRKFLRQVSIYSDSMDTSPYPRLFVLDFLTDEEKKKLEEQREAEEAAFQELMNKAKEEDLKKQEEEAREAKGQGDSVDKPASSIESKEHTEERQERPSTQSSEKAGEEERRPASAASQRPRSAHSMKRPSLMKKKSTYSQMQPMNVPGTEMNLCIRFLCEHEQGWHTAGPPMPVPALTSGSYSELVAELAPYMVRIMAILKHTSIDLTYNKTEAGRQLLHTFEEEVNISEPDFKDDYLHVRTRLMEWDEERIMGSLTRCSLQSGKVIWLCEHHKKNDGVTELSDEAIHVEPAAGDSGMDSVMVQQLQSMNLSADGSTQPQKAKLQRKFSSIEVTPPQKAKGKMIGAALAAEVTSSHKNKNSKACSVM